MTNPAAAAVAPSTAEPNVVPLDQIGIAPENLRAVEPADADIPELANTIDAAGLFYPLLVRPGRKGERPFMALDGRRRLLALQRLAAATRITPDYGAKVEIARDKALQAAANRVLALRIADQNALFKQFEAILAGILERAEATGKLERGMGDVEADELSELSEEVIRTDASTGAETCLVTFEIRTRRRIITADGALRRLGGVDQAGKALIVNTKTGEAAVLERGLTTIDDRDRLVGAVRIIGHLRERLNMAKTFAESAWEVVDEAIWRAAFDAQVATTDPWRTHELVLVTGLLLPIWKNLPKSETYVRRVTAPDGRRWLGRVLDSDSASKLKVALGLTDVAAGLGAGGHRAAAPRRRRTAPGRRTLPPQGPLHGPTSHRGRERHPGAFRAAADGLPDRGGQLRAARVRARRRGGAPSSRPGPASRRRGLR